MALFRRHPKTTQDTIKPKAKLPRWKRVLFGSIITLIIVAIAEIFSLVVLYSLDSRYSMQQLHNSQAKLAVSGTAEETGETIHPYLGWVMNPQTNTGSVINDRHYPINAYGLRDDDLGIPKRDPNVVTVAFLGGSVAWQVTAYGEQTFIKTLKNSDLFRDKEIRIVRLALPGYKQPQQLMVLNYYLALGAEFDVVVNLDGYNEIALPICENYEAGVSVAYPRMWNARMQNVVDPRVYGLSFQLLSARARRQELAQNIVDSPLRLSLTRNLIWKLRDSRQRAGINDFAKALLDKELADGRGFHSEGPVEHFENDAELYEHLVAIWKNCSLQLHHLCAANRSVYLHVLQPNQYFPNSKPIGPEEREIAIYDQQEYGKTIGKGYPLLISAGAGLQKTGVRFHDLTMLYSQVEEPIYVDLFCHYNQLGNDMLAEAIAEMIIESWDGTK